MRTSWVEKTRRYKRIEAELEAELERIMKEQYDDIGLGSCHIYWSLKKELLRKKYKIWFWRSPAELNRRIRFD